MVTLQVCDPDFELYEGDVREALAIIAEQSVQAVVTSPPYWNLRDYRVEGQLGREATLGEYIERLVEVFRDVRRVLRNDGTCWLTVGDGFSEKQLQMVPARLALALQEPYYAGRIKNVEDRIWLAAMVDAEGCIHIHRRRAFGVMVTVDNTSEAIIERCARIVGQGSRYKDEAGSGKQKRKQTLYRWTVTGQQSRELLRELYPHLVAKQHEARIAIASPSSGEGAREAHEAIKLLHNGGETTVDYDPPASLYERGWFVRSGIVWSKKPNAMPESVEDRPTTAHEFVYLLSKQPRYYYDADAISEPSSYYGPNGAGPTTEREANARKGEMKSRAGVRKYDFELPDRNARSVWTIATEAYPDTHFAVMPKALARKCILAGTREGDTVLDPFLGSGTTADVARRAGRKCIGIELSPIYCQMAAERLSQLSLLA